ncbi:MAG: phosphate signaling complex protein PhoU [Acutalibacteraceae bacterium]|nr:phosphate signaling complex protein PhoU [Acutalibacteraceae bacterium]
MRNYYQSQLDEINKKLIDMALLLEKAIENAIGALKENNKGFLETGTEYELQINSMEKEIEGLCLNVILRQQPVASDFHRVSAVLKMITDMERIGDIAEDITIHSVMLKESRASEIVDEAVKMGRVAITMLKNSINAYVVGDVELALNSCREDDVIDSLFETVMKQLVQMIKTDAKGAEEAPDLLMISKYFERMGDHTVNIAEWVVYAYTGARNIDLDSSQGIDEALSCIL